MSEFKSIRVFPTTDKTLPSFDNTKLVAINTCPVWGIIRYTHNKTMSNGGRAMALEAGGAAHEVFAAHRLFAIRQHGAEAYGVSQEKANEYFTRGGERIFGKQRFADMVGAMNPSESERTQMISFSLTALYNSGFYDDPGDKRRTVTNIEEMCIAYMDKYDWRSQMPVVLNDGDFIGIEIEVDVTIEFTLHDDTVHSYRFIGKADGIHWRDETMTDMRVHENKTASRLGEAWEESWHTNHQPTGYLIGLSTMLNVSIVDALMLGTCLPLPKGYMLNGLARVPVTRKPFQIEEWFNWFWHTVQLHDQYVARPLDAPQYTHSCNRYFRACSFIPLCASDPVERETIYDEMAIERWSPLEDEGSAD